MSNETKEGKKNEENKKYKKKKIDKTKDKRWIIIISFKHKTEYLSPIYKVKANETNGKKKIK